MKRNAERRPSFYGLLEAEVTRKPPNSQNQRSGEFSRSLLCLQDQKPAELIVLAIFISLL
jgi:hypothetical protein